MSDDIPIMRVPISLPCQVRVVPGTPDAEAPIEERTEFCAVDAWWLIGRASMCTFHLRGAFPELATSLLDELAAEGRHLGPNELGSWEAMHRYDQEDARGGAPAP